MKKELRICKTSDKNVIEDEYHFLHRCKPLKPVRKAFYAEHIEDSKAFKLLPDAVQTNIIHMYRGGEGGGGVGSAFHTNQFFNYGYKVLVTSKVSIGLGARSHS